MTFDNLRWRTKPPSYFGMTNAARRDWILSMTDEALRKYKMSLHAKLEELHLIQHTFTKYVVLENDEDECYASNPETVKRILRKNKSETTRVSGLLETVEETVPIFGDNQPQRRPWHVANQVVDRDAPYTARLDFCWRGTCDREALERWLKPNWEIIEVSEERVTINKPGTRQSARVVLRGQNIPVSLML